MNIKKKIKKNWKKRTLQLTCFLLIAVFVLPMIVQANFITDFIDKFNDDVYQGTVYEIDRGDINAPDLENTDGEYTPAMKQIEDDEDIDSKVVNYWIEGNDTLYIEFVASKNYKSWYNTYDLQEKEPEIDEKTGKPVVSEFSEFSEVEYERVNEKVTEINYYLKTDESKIVVFNLTENPNFELHIGSESDVYIFDITQQHTTSKIYNDNMALNVTGEVTTVTDELIAYWKLNDNANDVVGSNNGNPVGVINTTGYFNSAYNFDGIDDFLDMGNDDSLNFNTNDYSFSIWLKRDNSSNRHFIANKRQDATNSIQYEIEATDKLRHQAFVGGTDIIDIVSSSSLEQDIWYHVVFVVDRDSASNTRIYLNGVDDTSGTPDISASTIDNSGNLSIGKHGSGALYFNGTMDDIKFYNKTLSAEQVKALYQSTNDNYLNGSVSYAICINDCIKNDTLISQWTLNNNANDVVGNNNGVPLGLTNATGYYKNAYSFDGIDDVINLSDKLSDFEGNREGTFSIWFRTNFTGVAKHIFAASDNTQDNDDFGLLINQGVLNFFVRDGGNILNAKSPSRVDDNQWHHAVISSDLNGNAMYIDGNKIQIAYSVGNSGSNVWFNNVSNKNAFYIGAREEDNGLENFFNGTMDNIMIWNSSLTQQEVYRLYRSGYEKYINTNTYLNNITWSGDATASILESNANDSSMCDTRTIAHYKIDSNANDCSNSNNGIPIGVTNTTGIFNGAYSFDGIDDAINVSDSDEFSFVDSGADSAFTFSAWINPKDSDNFRVLSKGVYSNTLEYNFYLDVDSNPFIYTMDNSEVARIGREAAGTALLNDTWYHIVTTYDGSADQSGFRIYVDGVRVDDTDYAAGSGYVSMENQPAPFIIGAYDTVYANGTIDDVRIYNYSLTPKDIWEIYNARFNDSDYNLITNGELININSEYLLLEMNGDSQESFFNSLNLTWSAFDTGEVVDITPPVITIVSPENITYPQSYRDFNITANEGLDYCNVTLGYDVYDLTVVGSAATYLNDSIAVGSYTANFS